MIKKSICLLFLLVGCAGVSSVNMENLQYSEISAGKYTIATWSRITDTQSPVHVYIEGDGHAFDARGMPTHNPTPRGTMLRRLVASDSSSNVVYMARPCQFVMSDACSVTDWTSGRFSQDIIDSMVGALKKIVGSAPVVLVGYSGGATVTGLIIQNYTDINVQKWVTVAGVLNHADWTEYFGDKPLSDSLNLNVLPVVNQVHYVGTHDKIVPITLSKKWVTGKDLRILDNYSHGDFESLQIDFD